jgi:hypothetical protein
MHPNGVYRLIFVARPYHVSSEVQTESVCTVCRKLSFQSFMQITFEAIAFLRFKYMVIGRKARGKETTRKTET